MIPRSFSVQARSRVQRAAYGTLVACALASAASGWRLFAARSALADLDARVTGRQSRLAEDRRVAHSLPADPPSDALDRSRAVSRLRATLTALASKKIVSVDEFQASTEEAVYLTAYASDNKDPGWMQIPVRVTLGGRSTAIMATIAALRGLDVPFEIDTMEMTHRSTDSNGVATVSTGIAMRVLVYREEG